MVIDDSRANRLAFAGVSFLTVLTWYALPDAVRDRRARGVIKAGLLGVTAAGAAVIPDVFPEARGLTRDAPADLSKPALVAIGVGMSAAALVATVWAEKAIFAAGERRRAHGVRCAHTPAALAMALATGGAALVNWEKVSERFAASSSGRQPT